MNNFVFFLDLRGFAGNYGSKEQIVHLQKFVTSFFNLGSLQNQKKKPNCLKINTAILFRY